MEFAPGGDLCTMIENIGSMSEEHARFYIAEMAVAVGVLHDLGFIHRDLKPANFLVDREGHLKLTDFGLSKKAVAGFVLQGSCEVDPPGLEDPTGPGMGSGSMVNLAELQKADEAAKNMSPTAAAVAKAYSCVGSPDYMAPEMLKGKGYDEGVDYWSLGCIMYEFLTGTPPFHRETREETFHSILNWEQLKPIASEAQGMSPVAGDLINRLVCDPKHRLGQPQIARHAFFQGLDFKKLVGSGEPPFQPQLHSQYDTAYFAATPCGDFESELGSPSQATPRGQTHFQSPPEQMAFAGYSFKKFPSNSHGNLNQMAKIVQQRAKAHEKAKAAKQTFSATGEVGPTLSMRSVKSVTSVTHGEAHTPTTGAQVLRAADAAEEAVGDE